MASEGKTGASRPTVSVIVPVYNDAGGLRRCLDELGRQTVSPGSFEVVVVDNGSDASLRPRLDGLDHARMIDEPRPGSYAARNRGVRASRGEILAFCDADCLPRPDWIERGVSRLREGGATRIVGGAIEVFPANPLRPTVVEIYEMFTSLRQREYVEQGGFAATANVFVERALFESVGEFDDAVKSGGDVEWCKRAVRAGHRLVYAPDVRVRHAARRSLRDVLRKGLRIVGGVHDLRTRHSVRFFGRDRSIAADLVPPIGSAVALVRRRELGPPARRIGAASILLLARSLETCERIRLACGGTSRR